MLDESEAGALIERADTFFNSAENNPFMYMGTRILSGQEEAFYGWVAVNYLNGLYSGGMVHTIFKVIIHKTIQNIQLLMWYPVHAEL